jgi:SAM-dependent methyltransferase
LQELKCAICREDKGFDVLYKENFNYNSIDENTFSARRIPQKCHYRILKCKACGLVYSSPVLRPDEIEQLYKKSKLNYEAEIENIKETYGRYLKEAMNLVPSPQNILEIGCGNGFFLEKALDMGFKNVYGVEPSKDAVEKADKRIKDRIIIDIFRPGLFNENFFDLICFFQTIDHIIDPNELLQNCYKMLRPNGIVFCINHNTEALSTRILGERSPIFDIEHIYLFNKSTIKKIFEKNGFEVVNIIDITNVYSFGYWIRMLPFPASMKNFFLHILSFVNLNEKKTSVKSGNIGITVRKCLKL